MRKTHSARLGSAALGTAAVVVALSGCAGTTADTAADGEELQSVELMLSYQRSLAFIGEIMAQENGYFAEEGIELEPIASEGGTFVVQQLIAGNIPFGLANTEATEIAASQGYELEALAEHDRDIILIGAPVGGGVESVEDLEGKALGITDPGGGEVALVNAVLEAAGLSGVDTPAVGPGGPAVYNALETGQIAAYAGFTNDLAAVEASGLTFANILPDEFRGLPANSFVLATDATDEDKATFIKIVRAWTRGTIDALNDPELALEIGCSYVPEECEDMATARAYLDATLDGVQPREGLAMGEFDHDVLELQASVLAGSALGDEAIDFDAIFPNDAIEAINDFSTPTLSTDARIRLAEQN
ncbi:ABC transporter substrate-binding protein [Agromyces sp. SYSU T00194]|uniref:ABC transporter substrate-binding protein n=1 Tax=Agromyces chitinivorans TaxID=3158560 RepID=UPI003397CA57